MIALALVALAALWALSASSRSQQADANLLAADAAVARARAAAAALGIPDGHWEGSTWVTDPQPARGGGPPGLLLRREPEIRAMSAEMLADYVTTTRQWLRQGNTPTEAWWSSFIDAQSEILLRSARRSADLSNEQLDAVLSWLTRLTQAGIPLTSSEQGLLLNVREEHAHREEHGGTAHEHPDRRGADVDYSVRGDDEHSDYALERDLLDAQLRDEAEALEEEGLRRTR